jgi:hypothetical protein
MSTYIVIKTINGRQYRYRQSTRREGGRMRTKSEYLGPVDGGDRKNLAARGGSHTGESVSREEGTGPAPNSRRIRKRQGVVTEFIKNLVGKRDRRDDVGETEPQARERVAREDQERGRNVAATATGRAPR